MRTHMQFVQCCVPPTSLTPLPPGVILRMHRSTATNLRQRNQHRKNILNRCAEWEWTNRKVVKRLRIGISLYIFGTCGDIGNIAGYKYKWKVKEECILTHYEKNISYLISCRLNQICNMKIDTFWRITRIHTFFFLKKSIKPKMMDFSVLLKIPDLGEGESFSLPDRLDGSAKNSELLHRYTRI